MINKNAHPRRKDRTDRTTAWAIYEDFFNQLSVTNASVFDYHARTYPSTIYLLRTTNHPTCATIDYDMQLWDQGNGTRVRIPTHVLYSIYNLGKEFDVKAVWDNYTDQSAGLPVQGIGGQKRHFYY